MTPSDPLPWPKGSMASFLKATWEKDFLEARAKADQIGEAARQDQEREITRILGGFLQPPGRDLAEQKTWDQKTWDQKTWDLAKERLDLGAPRKNTPNPEKKSMTPDSVTREVADLNAVNNGLHAELANLREWKGHYKALYEKRVFDERELERARVTLNATEAERRRLDTELEAACTEIVEIEEKLKAAEAARDMWMSAYTEAHKVRDTAERNVFERDEQLRRVSRRAVAASVIGCLSVIATTLACYVAWATPAPQHDARTSLLWHSDPENTAFDRLLTIPSDGTDYTR
jgi:hypothetical protein